MNKKFEYKAITCPRDKFDIAVLNSFGEQGWELVWIDGDKDKLLVTFKRELFKED